MNQWTSLILLSIVNIIIKIYHINLRLAGVLPKADWLVLPNENAILIYYVQVILGKQLKYTF